MAIACVIIYEVNKERIEQEMHINLSHALPVDIKIKTLAQRKNW